MGSRYVHLSSDKVKKAALSRPMITIEPSKPIAQTPDIETDKAKHDLALRLAMGQIDGETFKFAMSALGCSPTLEALR